MLFSSFLGHPESKQWGLAGAGVGCCGSFSRKTEEVLRVLSEIRFVTSHAVSVETSRGENDITDRCLEAHTPQTDLTWPFWGVFWNVPPSTSNVMSEAVVLVCPFVDELSAWRSKGDTFLWWFCMFRSVFAFVRWVCQQICQTFVEHAP